MVILESTMMNSAEAFRDAISDSSRSWGISIDGRVLTRRIVKMNLLFLGVIIMSAVLVYTTATLYGSLRVSHYLTFIDKAKNRDLELESILTKKSVFDGSATLVKNPDPHLEDTLRNASMPNRTVILTTLNDAWAKPNSVFDLFLKSFHVGEQTARLLNHLVVIALDQKSYARCVAVHPHCYHLQTKRDNFTNEAVFMTSEYVHMLWRRIEFLGNILEMGYSFVFTDSDVMWFRDPFNVFFKDADFQTACDLFRGNSYDTRSKANGGFTYVRSNPRSISFYRFWYASRITYPGMHDQFVFNQIKNHPFLSEIKLTVRFFDTTYFGGFCEPSKDFNKVCTMHANCCVGLHHKVHDLKILLEDWKNYQSSPPKERSKSHFHWSVPQFCRTPLDYK